MFLQDDISTNLVGSGYPEKWGVMMKAMPVKYTTVTLKGIFKFVRFVRFLSVLSVLSV